jgi:hypothetical protein
MYIKAMSSTAAVPPPKNAATSHQAETIGSPPSASRQQTPYDDEIRLDRFRAASYQRETVSHVGRARHPVRDCPTLSRRRGRRCGCSEQTRFTRA